MCILGSQITSVMVLQRQNLLACSNTAQGSGRWTSHYKPESPADVRPGDLAPLLQSEELESVSFPLSKRRTLYLINIVPWGVRPSSNSDLKITKLHVVTNTWVCNRFSHCTVMLPLSSSFPSPSMILFHLQLLLSFTLH